MLEAHFCPLTLFPLYVSSAICGSNDNPNTLYCFVVDQAGVLLFHPDASRRSWESPVFFGKFALGYGKRSHA